MNILHRVDEESGGGRPASFITPDVPVQPYPPSPPGPPTAVNILVNGDGTAGGYGGGHPLAGTG